MPSFFAADGCTVRSSVAPSPGRHEGLSFAYRPCSSLEQAQYADASKGVSRVKAEELAADLIAGHVKEWDLTTRDGNAVPITAQVLLHNVHPEIVGRLFLIVWGTETGDSAGNS